MCLSSGQVSWYVQSSTFCFNFFSHNLAICPCRLCGSLTISLGTYRLPSPAVEARWHQIDVCDQHIPTGLKKTALSVVRVCEHVDLITHTWFEASEGQIRISYIYIYIVTSNKISPWISQTAMGFTVAPLVLAPTQLLSHHWSCSKHRIGSVV